MPTIINTQYGLFEKDAAEEIAAKMTAQDEDGWTYVARHDPEGTGKSFIEVLDEDGHSLGKLPSMCA